MPSTSTPITLTPIPVGQHVSSPFASALIQAQQGGGSAQSFLSTQINDGYDLQGLVTALQGTPQWVNGTVDGMPASYFEIGSATVAIVATETDPLDAQKINLGSGAATQTIHLLIGTTDGSTYSKFVAYTVDAVIAGASGGVFGAIVKSIVKRLQASLTTFMQGAPQGENVNGEGQPNDETQSQVQDQIAGDDTVDIPDYGTVEIDVQFDFTWVNTLTTVGNKFISLIGTAVVFVVVYFVVELLESVIFKTFNVQLNVYNITSQSLTTTVQYAQNVTSSDVGTTNQNVLGPVGSTGNSPFTNFQPTDPVISYGQFTIVNDSEVEGLGILMELSNTTSPNAPTPPDPSLTNVILTLDVPYIGSNSMSAWFNETSTDWEQLYVDQEGVNTGLAYQTTSGDYTIYLSTNAVSEASQNQYVVNMLVVDTANYENFQQFANGSGTSLLDGMLSELDRRREDLHPRHPFKGHFVPDYAE